MESFFQRDFSPLWVQQAASDIKPLCLPMAIYTHLFGQIFAHTHTHTKIAS